MDYWTVKEILCLLVGAREQSCTDTMDRAAYGNYKTFTKKPYPCVVAAHRDL